MLLSKCDLIVENNLGDDACSLVLMQFPAMKSQFDNPADLVKLSIKPKSMKAKLEVLLEPGDSEYCKETAKSIALKSIPKTFANDMVDKNIYTSTREPIEDGQLFVARIIDGKMICRPVKDILTLRSDFSHFDLKEEVDPKEEVKVISVKFSAQDRQCGSNASKPANAQQQADADEATDDYQVLKYTPLDSRDAALERDTLFGRPEAKVKPDPDALASDPTPMDVKPDITKLMPDIKPKLEKMDVDNDSPYNNQPQLTSKKAGFIKQKVKDCLLKAKLVNLEEVHQHVRGYGQNVDTSPINNKDVLDALSEYAVLVQGNWAIKSEVLYGDSSDREFTDVTGVSINLFINARDYLLWLFTKSRLVSRIDFSRSVRMPDHDILELFNQLAVYRDKLKRWELILPTDEKFLEKFPDIVTRQNTFWKVRRANKLAIFA